MSFNVDELTYLIFNQNKEAIQKWKKVQEICANDPLLKNDPTDYSKSRSELFELYSRKSARFHKLVGYDEDTAEIAVTIFPEQIITILSIKMFAPTIKNLGTERQVEKWLPPTLGFEIIGCYAQTELGHGSDVQSLETEAVYDAETEEFVLHSPTMTSTKWWVGDLGIFATHCVTHANLIIGGKNHGIQTFIVPLRDTKTFEPLPGISVGDIGPKIGYNAKDNGYVRFNYVRIPRENMLMRYSKVTKNGEFTKAMNEKIGYATMMQVRTSILRSAYAAFSAGITIALRYSLTRTQFKDDKGVEIPIFEYQTQQDKITPLIADCLAITFGAHKAGAITLENIRRINEKMDFSLMQDLHALVSSCKAVYTWQTYFGLEKLRQSCGGHGYSAFSRLPSILSEFAPTCTYEGENTVMLLQCARYLLKALSKASKGQPVNENVEYLVNIGTTLSQPLNIDRTSLLLCPETLRKVLRANAAFHVQAAAMKLISGVSERGLSQKQSWDSHAGIALVDASVAHNHYWTMRTFMDSIFRTSDESVKTVLGRTCCLYGISRVLERPNAYIEAGLLQGSQLEHFYEAKEQLLELLRPDVKAITDAFLFHDNQLNSALVQPDPYSTLLTWAKTRNPVNDLQFQKQIYAINRQIEGARLTPKF